MVGKMMMDDDVDDDKYCSKIVKGV